MTSIESTITSQFSRFFMRKDWHLFKTIADHYFKQAAFLKKRDFDINDELKLLARNIQKRLNIGIGSELLLKALFLKRGFVINLVKDKRNRMRDFPFLINNINQDDFHEDKTHTLNDLIEHLHKLGQLEELPKIRKGLKIGKVFRNKEGHVVLEHHSFDRTNYTDIENALVALYREGFHENLHAKFSLKENEKAIWEISSPYNSL